MTAEMRERCTRVVSAAMSASTEPRHDDRGNSSDGVPQSIAEADASTEPRHDDRGNRAHERIRAGSASGFNGAAAR